MGREHGATLLLFVLLAVIMTWPLTANLNRAVADPGDPYINTWILDWDWHATLHQPLHLFDANAFYPARYSLAFSENLYGIALLLFPFRAVGVAPITAHNLALLGGFAFSGFATYLLARFVTGNALAGITSGVFYAFVPFRFTHLSHVQHVWGGTLPLLLLALLWYSAKPTWSRATVFGAAFLFNGLCNIHWLLFGTVAIIVTAVIVRPRILPLATCTAVAALLLIGFLQPYFAAAALYGMRRSWAEAMSFSALPGDWLVSNFHNRLYKALRNPGIDAERWLFPGALSLIIGAVGLVTTERKLLKIACAWIALGFFGSLGLHTVLHRFLFSHVVGFQAIRVPARWASIAYVGLAMLVAIGAALLARRRVWAQVLIAVAFLVELRSAPIRWYMAVLEIPPVEQWVVKNRPRALLELPMSPNSEYAVMLHSTAHHRPIVNGISGFVPPEHERILELARTWSDQLIGELRRIGVSHIIVHADALGPVGRAWLQTSQLSFIKRFDAGLFGDWLFALNGTARPSPRLELVCPESIAGGLFTPRPESAVTPNTIFDGVALSPYGIREVNLLVNNGSIRLKTELPTKSRDCKPVRFTARFDKRPKGVWEATDVQPEIIDGRGKRVLLEDRWISWSP
jgi:hypothetical protein